MAAVERFPIALRAPIGKRETRQSGIWVLAAISVLAIPFENEYSLWGLSLAKLTIIPLFLAVVLLRPKQLFYMGKHRVFLCGAAFVAWGALAEAFQPLSDWEFIYRVFQTLVFAALVGAVSSDLLAYRRLLIAIAFVCSALALYLILAFYGAISVDVGGFREAGRVREQALNEISVATGLNILGYTVGMGAVVALARFFASEATKARVMWAAVYVLCAVGSFVPLSRGSFLALVGASIFVVVRNRRSLMKPGRMLLLVAVIALAFSFTPQALVERYTSLDPNAQTRTGKEAEGRMTLYGIALESLSDFWATGVGSGYYWKRWGPQKGYGSLGPHNGFLTAWIFFGLPGVLLLCLICFFAARDCPKPKRGSPESAALVGLLVLALFWIMFTHNLYLKSFGVILGLLMGASYQQTQLSAGNRWVRGRSMNARPGPNGLRGSLAARKNRRSDRQPSGHRTFGASPGTALRHPEPHSK